MKLALKTTAVWLGTGLDAKTEKRAFFVATEGTRWIDAQDDFADPPPHVGGYENPQAAFTMIELLIAIAISALVLVVVNTLFFGAMRERDRATVLAEQTLPVDRAIGVMKRDLLGILPVGVLVGAMGSDATGVGMIQSPLLEIYTTTGTLRADEPWGDVQKVDYSLQVPTNRNNYAGRDLVRGVTRNLLPTGSVFPEPQALLQDVANLKFSYYDGTNWNELWPTAQSNIPVAIRVSIDFASTRGQVDVQPPVQFTVPVVSWSSTNSVTNQLSN